VIVVAGTLRVPRTRGALSGLLLVLLGLWGGLVPFVGPYFDFAYTPDRAWEFNSGRFWLSVLPGVIAVLGGLIVLRSANRATGVLGAWLAALSGAWFVVGPAVSTLWTSDGSSAAGTPVGGTTAQAVTEIAFFTGVGAAIIFFAALALGRFTVVGTKETAMVAAEREAAEHDRVEHELAEEARRSHETHPDRTEELPAGERPAGTTYTTADDRGDASSARRLEDHPDEQLRPTGERLAADDRNTEHLPHDGDRPRATH
jgi:hypothetical protein